MKIPYNMMYKFSLVFLTGVVISAVLNLRVGSVEATSYDSFSASQTRSLKSIATSLKGIDSTLHNILYRIK